MSEYLFMYINLPSTMAGSQQAPRVPADCRGMPSSCLPHHGPRPPLHWCSPGADGLFTMKEIQSRVKYQF